MLLSFDTGFVDSPEDIAFVVNALEAHGANATFLTHPDALHLNLPSERV